MPSSHPLPGRRPTPPSLSRRTFLAGSAGGALAASASSPAGAQTARAPYVPYSPNSYFKSRVTGRKVDVEATSRFRAFMASFPDQQDVAYPQISGTGTNQWGTAWVRGTPSHPVWKIRTIEEASSRQNSVLRVRGFRAPRWLPDVITGTSDSPLCVMDVASGFTVFCTGVELVGDHLIDVKSAGVTHHASNGLDHRNTRSNDPRNFTSRGRISDAMVIRRDLIDHGIKYGTDLGHVLHLFMVETSTAAGFRHPMVGAESGKSGFGAEGQRLAIRADLDLTTKKLSPAGLVIARTLQTRGCYIGDNAGSASAFKAEQESENRPVWGGRLHQETLRHLTWDDFVVLGRR